MTLKRSVLPKGHIDYTVYALEGVWDITEEAKKIFDGILNKDDLVFNLMIRQPDFVSHSFFEEMLELTRKKKPQPLLKKVKLQRVSEEKCIQMLHIGSYDSEPETFEIIEEFAEKNNINRLSKKHREIYISDFRKVAPEKLRTVLRFQVSFKYLFTNLLNLNTENHEDDDLQPTWWSL